jgi:hypothetical protein
VLIDFDWQDADLIPALLRRPGISLCRVAGSREDEAGVRVAELYGVPRSLELADLTREIFDLALVGERSARRAQVESLLGALGTPVLSPTCFLGASPEPPRPPDAGAPDQGRADALGRLLDEAIPDLSRETPGPEAIANGRPLEDARSGPEPEPDDLGSLRTLLEQRSYETGATTAELHVGDESGFRLAYRMGPEDGLVTALVGLAMETDTPQVVSLLEGPAGGRAWGAWPFRSGNQRAVLAAAKVDPVEGRAIWEQVAHELRVTWDRSRPVLIPPRRTAWLSIVDFRVRLEDAVTRARTEGRRWWLHRLRFTGPAECVARLCVDLPGQRRGTDDICQPAPHDVLLLTTAAPEAFGHLRRRLTRIWEQVWKDAGQSLPAPPIAGQHLEISGAEDAASLQAMVSEWLAPA